MYKDDIWDKKYHFPQVFHLYLYTHCYTPVYTLYEEKKIVQDEQNEQKDG